MRRFLISAFAGLALGSSAFAAEQVKVDLTQIVAHPALDAVRKGVEDALAQAGYKQGKNLDYTYQSAQGSVATASQIARQFAGDKPDVIVAIGTPSAQTVLAATRNHIPVVFSAVSDPVAAKLVKSLDKPGGNITGVSDRSPVGEHVKFLQEIKPDLKKIGYLYNSSEANSVSTLKLLEELAQAEGIEVIPSSAARSADVMMATAMLVGKVDIIYVPTDNTIIAVLEAASRVAHEGKTPMFTADPSSIGRGPFAAQGVDYYDAGVETGKLAVRILKGEKPADIAIVIPSADDIFLDLQAVRDTGLDIPPAVLERAVRVLNQ